MILSKFDTPSTYTPVHLVANLFGHSSILAEPVCSLVRVSYLLILCLHHIAVDRQLNQTSQVWPQTRFFLSLFFRKNIYTLNILQALFGLSNRTPPTVLKLGPWNFQHRWPMLWGWSAREDFLIPPPQPAPGSKRCRQIRSGGPSAYFRASFAKYKLLGIVWGVN